MNEPNYYAVIPADVRYADIPASAKLLYSELSALTYKEGYCWASDSYFAELYGVTRQTINGLFRQLKENGFITIETANNKDSKKRKIYIAPVSKKPDRGVSKKPDNNNTSNNNINTITNVIEAKPSYGNENINQLMSDLYDGIGLKPVKAQQQRNFANHLLKRFGFENARKLIKLALELQNTDNYAYRVTSMQDLWYKQNQILVSAKKNFQTKQANQIRSV